MLSRTPAKTDDAHKLGATDLLLTTDDKQLEQARGRFDLILDTIPGPHDLSPLLRLLALDGTLSLLGFPVELPVRIMDLTYGRKKLLPSARVQEALTRLARGDVRYRFVLDLSDLG